MRYIYSDYMVACGFTSTTTAKVQHVLVVRQRKGRVESDQQGLTESCPIISMVWNILRP